MTHLSGLSDILYKFASHAPEKLLLFAAQEG